MKRGDNTRGMEGRPELAAVETLLNVGFSTGFQALWNVCVPQFTPPFTLSICDCGGEMGACRSHPDGYEEHGWIIELGIASVEKGLVEHVLAHEVMHLVLYWAGFPGTRVDVEADEMRVEVANRIESVISHPIITARLGAVWDTKTSTRMRKIALDEDLNHVMSWPADSANDEIRRHGHVLSYLCARLDGGDPVAEALGIRWPAVRVEGDEILGDLRQYGYGGSIGEWAADITPEQAIKAGEWLVKRFGVGDIATCEVLYEMGAPVLRV
jgi:hypothetical protein